MSIVCGYRPPGSGRVWLASDSRSTGGYFIFPERTNKLRRIAGWLIGASGPDPIHEIVEGLKTPSMRIGVFRNDVMAALKAAGWETEKQDRGGEPPSYGFSMIAAQPGELWGIAPSGAIWSPEDGFIAIGSGQDFAYGAFFPQSADNDPKLIVRSAVMAAIHYRADCGGDVAVESIG
jgi:ATP-dependent protease HslVU (ClpYQ) peptidase subunit